jgi:membrane protein required for colicin V production
VIGVDFAILAIILLSALISLVRGFVREAMSLVGWVAAIWISITFAGGFSELGIVKSSITDVTLRLMVSFLALFVMTLIVSGVINFFSVKLVQRTGLTGTDRFLGVVFGFIRGALLVIVLVLLAGLTPMPKESWWDDSFLLFRFEAVAVWLSDFLPSSIAGKLSY